MTTETRYLLERILHEYDSLAHAIKQIVGIAERGEPLAGFRIVKQTREIVASFEAVAPAEKS